MKEVRFLDLECVEWQQNGLKLIVAKSVGPRILSLRLGNNPNIFAELPDLTLDCPGVGPFHFYGGHRLWQAPEQPVQTYLPDDVPVEILAQGDSLSILEQAQRQSQLRRELQLAPGPVPNSITVEHFLSNEGEASISCSAWAITQFKVGGNAWLPQNVKLAEGNPRLPNRSLALWPYTDLASAHIRWGHNYCRISANLEAQDSPLKLGFPNPDNWLAYQLDDLLFMKWAHFDPDQAYFDSGSSSECYCNDQFIELETLGPISRVPPGQRVSHTEIWQLVSDVDPDKVMPTIDELINKQGRLL